MEIMQKKIEKFYRFKTRFLISIILGLLCCAGLYLLLFTGLKFTKETLFILFIIPEYLLKIFLFISSLVFSFLTLYILLKNGYSKGLVFQIVFAVTISLLTAGNEFLKIEHSNLYKEVSRRDLTDEQFNKLYLRSLDRNDISALTNLERNENIPDSIELKLSYSNHFDIKQEVAWRTNSKSILIRLSKDNNPRVRSAVATNKMTPIEILGSLQRDSNEIVKNTAFAMFQARTSK